MVPVTVPVLVPCRLGEEDVLVPGENCMLLERRSDSGFAGSAVFVGGTIPEVGEGRPEAILVNSVGMQYIAAPLLCTGGWIACLLPRIGCGPGQGS